MSLTITATELCEDTNTRIINEEVRDLLGNIEEQIKDDHEKHKSHTIFELPIVFSAENMETDELQLLVYGQIIEELEDKEFKVKIRLEANSTKLLIKWPAKLDEKTKKKYSKLIENRKV